MTGALDLSGERHFVHPYAGNRHRHNHRCLLRTCCGPGNLAAFRVCSSPPTQPTHDMPAALSAVARTIAVPTQRFGTGGGPRIWHGQCYDRQCGCERDSPCVRGNERQPTHSGHEPMRIRFSEAAAFLTNLRTNNGTPSSRGTTRGVAFETGKFYGSLEAMQSSTSPPMRPGRLTRPSRATRGFSAHRNITSTECAASIFRSSTRQSAADRRAGQWRLYLGGCSSCRRGGRRVPHHGDAHRRRHRQFHLCHTRQDRQRPAHRRHWRLRHDNRLALEFDRQQCHQADTL